MAVFFYRCKNDYGIKTGFLEAKNIQEASSELESKGFIVLELKEESSKNLNIQLNYELNPLTIKEKKDFYNSFYRQYKAGISYYEIFNNIMTTASSSNIKSLCFNIIKKLQKNCSIDEVFAYYSRYLGKMEAAFIIAGDKSGKLENVLNKISQLVKEQEELRANLISKMTYPALIFGLIIFSCLVFVFFVFPAFSSTIDGQDVELTALCIKAAVKILASFGLLGYIVLKIKNNKELQKKFIDWFLGLKFLDEVIKNYCFSSYFSSLSLAQEAGVSLREAFEISNRVFNSLKISKNLSKAQEMIEKGCEIATAFEIAGVFSEYAISQINSAEKSGELAKAYEDIAQDYKKEYLAKIDTLTKLVEPIMLGIAAIIILVLGTKMYSKYYEALFSLF